MQVRAIIERCQSLGDAKDNTEEREKIQKAIHETQQVRTPRFLTPADARSHDLPK